MAVLTGQERLEVRAKFMRGQPVDQPAKLNKPELFSLLGRIDMALDALESTIIRALTGREADLSEDEIRRLLSVIQMRRAQNGGA